MRGKGRIANPRRLFSVCLPGDSLISADVLREDIRRAATSMICSTGVDNIMEQPVREIVDIAAVPPPSVLHRMTRRGSKNDVEWIPHQGDRAAVGEESSGYRFLTDRIPRWAASTCDMIVRLHRDAEDLCRQFGVRFPLVSITHSGGDEHAGGSAVLILEFDNGTKVVYKPRGRHLLPLLTHVIEAVERICGPLLLHFPQTMSRTEYSWSAFINDDDLTGSEMQSYRSLGALAALTWALGGRDLHGENIAFRREGIYVLDEECFFSPLLPTAEWLPPDVQRTLSFYQESVAYTGVFPLSPVVDGIGQEDCSAVSALHGRWRRNGTLPNRWQEEFLSGFDLFLDAFPNLWPGLDVSPVLRRSHQAATRVVIRSTQFYSDLLNLHFTVASTQQIAEQIRRSLYRTAAFEPWRTALLERELATLLEGDIPLCTAPIAGRGLTMDGLTIDIAAIDGLQAVRRRCQNISAHRVAKWEARASLCGGTLESDGLNLTERKEARAFPQETVGPDVAVRAAHSVARALIYLAREHHDGSISWSHVCVSQLRGQQLSDAGTSISTGSAGIMLALSAVELTSGLTEDLAQMRRLTSRLWSDWSSRACARGQERPGVTATRWLIDDLTVLAFGAALKRPVSSRVAATMLEGCRRLAEDPMRLNPAVRALFPFLASILADVSRSTDGRTSSAAWDIGKLLIDTMRAESASNSFPESRTSLVTARAVHAFGVNDHQQPNSTATYRKFLSTAGPDFVQSAVRGELQLVAGEPSSSIHVVGSTEDWGLRHGAAGRMALSALLPGRPDELEQFGALLLYLTGCEAEALALSLPAPGLATGAAALAYELARQAINPPIPSLLPMATNALLAEGEP